MLVDTAKEKTALGLTYLDDCHVRIGKDGLDTQCRLVAVSTRCVLNKSTIRLELQNMIESTCTMVSLIHLATAFPPRKYE